MTERRNQDRRESCMMHESLEETLKGISDDIKTIMDRQIVYAERIACIEQRQIQVEKIVTNGLSHNVQNIVRRLDKLDEFGWFRKPVTKLKDSMFWYALKIAIAGGGLYIVMHFGDELIKGVVK